jgi:pimeloyl-ACP methyl ester carboxylesterase
MAIPRAFIRGEHGEDLRDPEGLRAAGVDVTVIPGAGHLVMADAPGAFVAALATTLGVGAA